MIYKVMPIKSPQDKTTKYYARAVHFEDIVNLEELSEHMANHNTPYSAGVIKGVLTDMVSCIRELVLEGRSVKLPDLAIFNCAIISKGADTKDDFSVKANVTGYRLHARATGSFRSSELEGKVTLKNIDTVGTATSSATE